jgi:hypothetical protein
MWILSPQCWLKVGFTNLIHMSGPLLSKTMLPKAEIHSCSGNQRITIRGLSTAKLWFQWWQNYGYSHRWHFGSYTQTDANFCSPAPVRRSPARKPWCVVGRVPVVQWGNAGFRLSQICLISIFSPKIVQSRILDTLVPVDPGTEGWSLWDCSSKAWTWMGSL